jgi:hypothetical protein
MELKSLLDFSEKSVPVPMTEDQSRMFLVATINEENDPAGPEDCPEEHLPKQYLIIESRLAIAGFADKCSFWVKMFLGSLCDTPGSCVIWAYALCDMIERSGLDMFTMSNLTQYFPYGFPSESCMGECWDYQKNPSSPGGNMYDNEKSWKIREQA